MKQIVRRRPGSWLALATGAALLAGDANAGAASMLDGVDRRILQGEVIPRYLVGFGLNTGWPDLGPADTAFGIGVLGRDPSDGALEKLLAGKKLKGRPIAVRHADDPAALAVCQIVFANVPSQEDADRLLRATATKPVLTVLFSPDRTIRGFGVELLLTKDGSVRYTVGIKALREAGLMASPELLQLALRAPPR